MKERPILFSGEMVRAILDGRKTQTRRVVSLTEFEVSNTPGYDFCFRGTRRGGKGHLWQDFRTADFLKLCPYGYPGDRLWVREAWGLFDTQPSDGPERAKVFFRATDGERRDLRYQLWRPSIHMPRWASRITLEVVSVRVERLQDISEQDAAAEGASTFEWRGDPDQTGDGWVNVCQHREAFIDLWDSINGKDKTKSWDANPWVWVVEFKRL